MKFIFEHGSVPPCFPCLLVIAAPNAAVFALVLMAVYVQYVTVNLMSGWCQSEFRMTRCVVKSPLSISGWQWQLLDFTMLDAQYNNPLSGQKHLRIPHVSIGSNIWPVWHLCTPPAIQLYNSTTYDTAPCLVLVMLDNASMRHSLCLGTFTVCFDWLSDYLATLLFCMWCHHFSLWCMFLNI